MDNSEEMLESRDGANPMSNSICFDGDKDMLTLEAKVEETSRGEE